VLSFGPFSALYFVYYEQLKGLAEAFSASNDSSTSASTRRPPPEVSTTTPLSLGAVLACSATAASLAALWYVLCAVCAVHVRWCVRVCAAVHALTATQHECARYGQAENAG
jgi:hypothetical protein